MITRKKIEEFWSGRAEPPSELEWQIHLMELKANLQLNRTRKESLGKPGRERKLRFEVVWSPTSQIPYTGRNASPEEMFWAHIKGIYEVHKGMVNYAWAARLTLHRLGGLLNNFPIPPKPDWWLYPW